MMNKPEIMAVLFDYKKEFAERYGILEIGLFGSVSRGDSTINSDVDIVIRIDRPDLFKLAGIMDDLEERLSCPVDLVTYWEGMNRYLKRRIDDEAFYA